MSTTHVHYVLIGGGLASSSAAEAIRAIDPNGSVVLIGQENSRPYHRPPLSKEFLRNPAKRDELFTLPDDWFARHDVQLRTGRRAVHLDASRHCVSLDNGDEISGERLLLATGASPRALAIPGATLPGVFYLRTLEDCQRLQTAAAKAKADSRGRTPDRGRGNVVVIGGGVLGVELTASMTQLGLAVDLVITGDFPWNVFAGEATGRFLTHYLEHHGARVHTGGGATRIEGDGRAQRVVLADGAVLPCDFVIAAVGATANKDLLRGTPLSAGKAIIVDDHCRTTDPAIYAAGDCAAVFDPLFGKHRVLEHWDNAKVTGTIAGTNMAGGSARYDAVNYFFSDVFELSLSGWGEARLVDRRIIRGTPQVESPDFVEFGIAADGRLAQVIAVGHSGEDDRLRGLVARRATDWESAT